MSESLKINAPNLICNGVSLSDIKAERDYWKREAIKNAAELGEIKIKQAPIKIEDDNCYCPVCNNELCCDPEDAYCNMCGQAVYW